MSPSPANTPALEMDLPLERGEVSEVLSVTIFQDSTGGLWIRTYSPLSPSAVNELRDLEESGKLTLQVEPMPAEDFRAIEMAWLQAHMEELTKLHPGEWLAVDGPELVAHAGDLPDLLRQAVEAGHPNPFITAIPAEPILSLHF